MRVLFDGFWWTRGPESNRQVMRAFVRTWIDVFPDDDVSVAVPRACVDTAQSELGTSVLIIGTRLRPQGISAIAELPFIARRVHADVTIAHNFTPAFGVSAVFIHDFMFLESPEWFTRPERAYFALMPLTARNARWIFTSSRTEADRIGRLSRGRTVVPVGLAVGHGLTKAVPRRPEALARSIDTFLLSVGRLNVRKNLATTIEAALLSGRVTTKNPLIVVGEPQGLRADLSGPVATAARDGMVMFLGFIEDAELAWLYRHTSLLVFLSRDEGFGLPALEALHFGAPIVVSDIPVFREILGADATYADPNDVQAISDAIRSTPPRTAITPRGDRGYSWPASVTAMRDAIRGTPASSERPRDPHR